VRPGDGFAVIVRAVPQDARYAGEKLSRTIDLCLRLA
jgi:hypothetical protein